MKKPMSKAAKPFFYAGEDADLYDATARLTDRAYDLLHEVVTDCILASMQNGANNDHQRVRTIADVGCGTGEEALRMLLRLPHHRVVCIDHSAEMLQQLERKVVNNFGERTAGGRVVYALEDVRTKGWFSRSLSALGNRGEVVHCDAVVSVYALHHFLPKQKGEIYREVLRHLKPRGLFVNADLCDFETPWLARLAQDKEEGWINKQFTDPHAEFGGQAARLGRRRHRLRRAWIDHLRRENVPLSVQSQSLITKRASSRQSEFALLAKAGFSSCECPFRFYQSALMLASA